MRSIAHLTILGAAILCVGCDRDVPGNLPPITPVSELPVFTEQENEIEIADSLTNSDPTMVLGAVVDRENGRVHSFDTFLREDGKTERQEVSKLVFRDFVDNSVVADAEWLTFLKGQVNDSMRAEVMVTEVSNASLNISAIDKNKLQAFARDIPTGRRDHYGVVIAFRDFLVSASLFKEQGAGGNLSGYGAKIGGKWYGKHESMSADHRVIAVWAPLPFVLEKVAAGTGVVRDESLNAVTLRALKGNDIQIKPLDGRRWFVLRSSP